MSEREDNRRWELRYARDRKERRKEGRKEGKKERRRMGIEWKKRGDVENESGMGLG